MLATARVGTAGMLGVLAMAGAAGAIGALFVTRASEGSATRLAAAGATASVEAAGEGAARSCVTATASAVAELSDGEPAGSTVRLPLMASARYFSVFACRSASPLVWIDR